MSAATAERGLHCEQLPSNHPVLVSWLVRFHATQAPHFSHAQDYSPANWLALLHGDRVLSAFGYTHCVSNVVLVEYALCEPSRIGLTALRTLMGICFGMWHRKHKMRFFTENTNLRMRAMVEALGAKPVASLYEIGV